MISETSTPDLLEAIVAATRRIVEVRAERQSLREIEKVASRLEPRAAAFQAALSRANAVNVMAECKRRSPSAGVLRNGYDPAALARAYEAAGAVALSVLTEPTFFDGSLDHLSAAREATALPILRKDFVVSEYQLLEARAAGADAVLLIVAALQDRELRDLLGAARGFGLATLVEVHDASEAARAVDAGATIIGVNNRNLRTLAVDLEVSHTLIRDLPAHAVTVAESGVRTAADIAALRQAGYHAFLIGERLMASDDPGGALRELLRAPGDGGGLRAEG